MSKSLARFEKKIINSSDATTLKKSLYLDANSYFLWLYKILIDPIKNYQEDYDYSYLSKTFNFLKYTYIKLLYKKRYTEELVYLRNSYLKLIKEVNDENIKTYKYIIDSLNSLLADTIEKKYSKEDPLYELLVKYLFQDRKIEYVSKILNSNTDLFNSKIENESLFIKIIKEYLESVIKDNEEIKNFYLRVINKFILEEEFELSEEIKNKAINILKSYYKIESDYYKNIEISKLIKAIIKRTDLFNMFHINNVNVLEEIDNNIKKDGRIIVNDYILTIDDEDTFVLDDALSYEKLKNGNILFKVHIADPLAITPFESDTIKEALLKSTSIYLDKNQLPMIDLSLSGDKMSLIKGKTRYAKTIFFEFDSSYNLIRVYFDSTIIKVSERTSYDKVNESYKKGGKNKEEYERLKIYDEILRAIKNELKNVNVDSIQSEINIGKCRKLENFSENLIAYSMVFSGKSMAKIFQEKGYPFIYRCHIEDLKFKEEVSRYIGNSKEQNVNRLLKGMLSSSKAFYSLVNYGHNALNLDVYSHCTSPLRRFSDVLNWLIYNKFYLEHMNDKELYNFVLELDKICKYINLQKDTTEDYMRFYSKVKMKNKN